MSAQIGEVPKAVAAARDFDGQASTDNCDCAGPAAEHKSLATLQACWALEGNQLHRAAPGFLLIDRFGHSRSIATMRDAQIALDQIGGGAQ